MSNTITLSTDMNTLYLIDDERAIPFDLTGKGAVIGTLGGQVSVVSASSGKKSFLAGKGQETRKEFPIKSNQWTVNYNEDNVALHVVGAIDLDSFSPNPSKEPSCAKSGYDLSKELVTMRRVGGILEVTSTPIKTVVKGENV